jgi:8-oxo-dGTP pyrophosphatase MutT (NUDIX family)
MSREKLFQIGIKALITNRKGQILVLDSGDWHLKNQARHWDIPGGRVQEGHSIVETLQREVEEETGIKEIKRVEFFYAVNSNFKDMDVDGRLVGLILMIYKVRIPENSKIVLSHEHSGYEWVDKKEAAARLSYKYPKEFTALLT